MFQSLREISRSHLAVLSSNSTLHYMWHEGNWPHVPPTKTPLVHQPDVYVRKGKPLRPGQLCPLWAVWHSAGDLNYLSCCKTLFSKMRTAFLREQDWWKRQEGVIPTYQTKRIGGCAFLCLMRCQESLLRLWKFLQNKQKPVGHILLLILAVLFFPFYFHQKNP